MFIQPNKNITKVKPGKAGVILFIPDNRWRKKLSFICIGVSTSVHYFMELYTDFLKIMGSTG